MKIRQDRVWHDSSEVKMIDESLEFLNFDAFKGEIFAI